MPLVEMSDHGHDRISYFNDDSSGLQAIIAVHDTTLGPSLGGTRILDYESETAALTDVLRLSKAMTYKAAAADLDLGGGKAVILGDPDKIKTTSLMRAYGRAVESLNGTYITCEDVNSTVSDMDIVAEETDHVVGTSDGLGDPSPVTAEGVFSGLKACVEARYGSDSLDEISVVVQGIGKVGQQLAESLIEAGADVTVSDIDEDRVESFAAKTGAETVPADSVFDEPCDVFAPCALGGAINDDTIERLDCDIIAGCANNVLESRRHASMLANRDILYAPDYVINAGGLITMAQEVRGGTKDEAISEAREIGDRLQSMIQTAQSENITVLDAADQYAENRIPEPPKTETTIENV